jgi:hypothetical protein
MLCAATSAAAQGTTQTSSSGAGVVSGTVYDSLSHHVLAGAIVDLAPAKAGVGCPGNATSDSLGHYEIDRVAPGAYVIGFFHPWLDSLGIEAPVRQVTVAAGAHATMDLAVPSARRIHDAVCSPTSKADSTGMLVGHVDDAVTGSAVAGAVITAQWANFTFANGRLSRSVPTVRVQASPLGWFAFCSLPSAAAISVQASREGDSSGVVTIVVRPADVTVRTIYIAKATTVTLASTDSANVPDSLRAAPQQVYRGSGLLSGMAHNSLNGSAIAGVQLTVEGTGLTAESNAQGQFSLSDLPLGSQMLLARKVGFVPSEVVVDLFPGTAARADVTMPTVRSVMDTVKVFAQHVYDADNSGFLRREKMGFGHYFDVDQIARIQPYETTDLMRRVPSVRIQESGFTRRVLMRSMTGGMCEPDIYVDGMYMIGMSTNDLDMMVHPDQVAGVEVYTSPVEAPPDFQMGKNTCGVIAVWTQAARPMRQP